MVVTHGILYRGKARWQHWTVYPSGHTIQLYISGTAWGHRRCGRVLSLSGESNASCTRGREIYSNQFLRALFP